MIQDLTSSQIDRQNILNNKYALQSIRQSLDITPIEYKGVFYLTKQMVADFYEVDIKTITRCLDENESELRFNGYIVLQGNDLKDFKLSGLKDINVPKNTPQLGIFDFRSFLNIGISDNTNKKWDEKRKKSN